MFSSVVGHSEEPDADAAVEEIVQQCKARLNGTVPSAGLLFAAPARPSTKLPFIGGRCSSAPHGWIRILREGGRT